MKKLICISLLFLLTACPQAEESTRDMDDTKSKLKRITQKIKSNGDLQTAALLESKIILLDESDPASYITLAKSLNEMNKSQEALQVLLDGEEINPDHTSIKLEIAKTLIENQKPEAALEKINEIGSMEDKDFYNAKGVALDTLGQYEQAQDSYSAGLSLANNNGVLLNNLALSYLLSREYDEGIDILEDLVKRADASDKYRANLALAYGLDGQDKKAYNILIKDISAKEAKENLKYYKEFR